jgi:hypothetical protein
MLEYGDRIRLIGQKFKAMQKPWRAAAIGAIVLIGALLLFWITDRLFLLTLSRSYVSAIARAFDLNRHLAEALSLVTFVALAACLSLVFSFSRQKRLAGYLGIIGLLIANSLALWQGTKNQFFEASGEASKCYVMTREGVRFGEHAGVDAQSGRPCRPVTADMIYRLQRYAEGHRPERVTGEDPIFFDLKTGEPVIWFARGRSGEVELFDLMGFHPETGEELQPINKELVGEWRAQQRQIEDRPPQRISNPDNFVFYNPKTGKPQAWYWRGIDGSFEFYDNKGFQPRTGEPLKVITPQVIADYNAQSAQKCYIVTRETVRFGSREGLDPQTGRQCRPFNAALLERLRAYERGDRPKLVAAKDPIFFDLRTGEPNLWYSRDDKGRVRFFDLIGFDPETGQELQPITTDIVTAWRKQGEVATRPPKLIDPDKYTFFDTISGEPHVWYWRDPNGTWEFYDSPGFRATGERLTLVSREVIDRWRREDADYKHRIEQQQAAALETQRVQAQKAVSEQQAGDDCDSKAANPNDARKPSNFPGVEYNDLKVNARAAADACALAVKVYPGEPRFRYNWARALEFINPQQSINIYVDLTKQQYPAAFDNFGGVILRERKDIVGAVKQYEAGAKLGDSGAMVSLAYLIRHNLYQVTDPENTRYVLLTRAAKSGNRGALEMLDKEKEESSALAYRQQSEKAQQQMMMNLFGGIVRGIAR